MNQYTPLYRAAEYPEINRRLTTFEYDSVVNHAFDRGFRQCFIQRARPRRRNSCRRLTEKEFRTDALEKKILFVEAISSYVVYGIIIDT